MKTAAALLAAASVLTLALLARQVSSDIFGDTPGNRVLEESLLIMGWVANWRPIEIFLYEWWPLVRTRRLYTRLAQAPVVLQALD